MEPNGAKYYNGSDGGDSFIATGTASESGTADKPIITQENTLYTVYGGLGGTAANNSTRNTCNYRESRRPSTVASSSYGCHVFYDICGGIGGAESYAALRPQGNYSWSSKGTPSVSNELYKATISLPYGGSITFNTSLSGGSNSGGGGGGSCLCQAPAGTDMDLGGYGSLGCGGAGGDFSFLVDREGSNGGGGVFLLSY